MPGCMYGGTISQPRVRRLHACAHLGGRDAIFVGDGGERLREGARLGGPDISLRGGPKWFAPLTYSKVKYGMYSELVA